MIGHPNRQFYMLTTGVISRYFTENNAGIETQWLSATAEIGGGASGAPLLNQSGAVVGMASTTQPVYSAAHENDTRTVQMVIRRYVPASAILELLTPDSGIAGTDSDSPKRFVIRMEALERSEAWDTLEHEADTWITDHPNQLSTAVMLASRLMGKPGREGRRVGERMLRKILVTEPDSAVGLNMLGMLLHSQGRHVEAVDFDRRLLELDPTNVRTMNNLAWALSQALRQHEEALSLAEKALKLAPEYADLLDTHGVVCWRLKRYDEAEASFKEALGVYKRDGSVAPASVVSRFNLAELYWETGRKQEAGRFYRECLDLQKTLRGLSPQQADQARLRCQDLSNASDRPRDP
jgi:tetratricopeptide (TPR) repeat protein